MIFGHFHRWHENLQQSGAWRASADVADVRWGDLGGHLPGPTHTGQSQFRQRDYLLIFLKKNISFLARRHFVKIMTKRHFGTRKMIHAWLSKHVKGQSVGVGNVTFFGPKDVSWSPLSVTWRFLDQWRSAGPPCQWRDVFCTKVGRLGPPVRDVTWFTWF